MVCCLLCVVCGGVLIVAARCPLSIARCSLFVVGWGLWFVVMAVVRCACLLSIVARLFMLGFVMCNVSL